MRPLKVSSLFLLLLLPCCLLFSQADADQEQDRSLQSYVDRAKSIAEDAHNTIDNIQEILNASKEVELPLSLLPQNGDDRYSLVIDSINFTPDYAYVVMYMVLPLGIDSEEDGDQDLVFIGRDIRFSRTGGFSGDVSIELGQNVDFDVGGENGGTISILAEAGKTTQLNFDCDGFKSIDLFGRAELSRSFAIPENPDGSLSTDPNKKVMGEFRLNIEDWEDWVAEITLNNSKFQLAKLPDFTFEMGTIAFDHSDLKNPSNIQFPDNYDIDGLYPQEQFWRGFYMQRFSFTLPKAFRTKNSEAGERMSFDLNNLIIDKSGFTGHIVVNDVLPPGEGDARGWEISVNKLEVKFVSGTFSSGGFEGGMSIPISKSDEEHYLEYNGEIESVQDGSGYRTDIRVTITNGQDLDMELWKAQMTIDEGSQVELAYVNKTFQPSALLTGDITIGADLGGSPVGLKVRVEKLKIQTNSPTVSIEPGGGVKFSADGANALKNFPVQLEEAGIKVGGSSEELGLYLKLSVNFMKSEGNGFGGSAGLTVWGERNASNRRWDFDRIQLNSVCIAVENPGYSISGCVTFFEEGDNEKYGEGFEGNISAEFQPGISVDVYGIFGNVDGYRYWMVDAAVGFPTPITIFPALGINGFSGGAYHHMTMDPTASNADDYDGLGQTTSGIVYNPDESVFLGIKAGLKIVSIPTESVFNGDLNFEISFNHGGGINQVIFSGGAKVVKPLSEGQLGALEKLSSFASGAETSSRENMGDEAAISVEWLTYFDVPNKVFSGNFKVFVNVADVVIGVGDNNKAGEIAIYISPDDWYFYIGKPADMCGLKFVDLVEIKSYFVAGTVLPDPPIAPMPDDLFESYDASKMINYDLLGIGSGFSFGTRASITVGGYAPLFVCSAEVGADFYLKFGGDIMFMKSQDPPLCDVDGSIEERGVNGWYATGQMFAGMGFRLGVKYDCFPVGSGFFPIAEAHAAIALAAQLPNPSYFIGFMEARVDIFGGVIKGTANVEIEFGDECAIDRPESIAVVDKLTPFNETRNVDVNKPLIVDLKLPNHDPISIPQGDELKTVRVDIIPQRDVTLRCTSCENSEVVPGTFKWNDTKTQLIFSPHYALHENEEYSFQVDVWFQKLEGDNWVRFGNNSSPVESHVSLFTTREELETIDMPNILYAYPLPDMKNMYVDEYGQGYLKAAVIPTKALSLPGDYKFVAKISGGNLNYETDLVNVSTTVGDNNISYPLPVNELKTSTTYTFTLVKRWGTRQNVDNTIRTGSSQGNAADDVEMEEIEVVSYDFTTSSYRTFSEKFSAMSKGTVEQNNAVVIQKYEELKIGSYSSGAENISEEELRGYMVGQTETTDPLIQVKIKPLPGAMNEINTSMYTESNIVELRKFAQLKGESERTYPPLDAVYLSKNYDKTVTINFEVFKTMSEDARFLETWNAQKNNPIPVFNPIEAGEYEYLLGYYLPGQKTPNSLVDLGFTLSDQIALSE